MMTLKKHVHVHVHVCTNDDVIPLSYCSFPTLQVGLIVHPYLLNTSLEASRCLVFC